MSFVVAGVGPHVRRTVAWLDGPRLEIHVPRVDPYGQGAALLGAKLPPSLRQDVTNADKGGASKTVLAAVGGEAPVLDKVATRI